MADKTTDPSVIVTARHHAATLSRRPNGQIDFEQASRVYDWIMAAIDDKAADRHKEMLERMAKARAARKPAQSEIEKIRSEAAAARDKTRGERLSERTILGGVNG